MKTWGSGFPCKAVCTGLNQHWDLQSWDRRPRLVKALSRSISLYGDWSALREGLRAPALSNIRQWRYPALGPCAVAGLQKRNPGIFFVRSKASDLEDERVRKRYYLETGATPVHALCCAAATRKFQSSQKSKSFDARQISGI